jgi:hypothetical protein
LAVNINIQKAEKQYIKQQFCQNVKLIARRHLTPTAANHAAVLTLPIILQRGAQTSRGTIFCFISLHPESYTARDRRV